MKRLASLSLFLLLGSIPACVEPLPPDDPGVCEPYSEHDQELRGGICRYVCQGPSLLGPGISLCEGGDRELCQLECETGCPEDNFCGVLPETYDLEAPNR